MVLAWKQQHNVFTIGTGATFMQVCFSEEGTLMQFESPAGFEHLRAGGSGEGYALCSRTGVHGFAASVAEDGFGPPTSTQPGGPGTFPLTSTRTTTDGIFQLTQTFSRDSSQLALILSMTLKTLSSVAQSSVQLSRYFHGALDNDAGDDKYSRTPDTVVEKESYGVMLTAQTFGTGHTIAGEKFQDWTSASGGGTARGCTAIGQPTPTAPGDFVGRVTYNLGTINPGSSKTVKMVYRRF